MKCQMAFSFLLIGLAVLCASSNSGAAPAAAFSFANTNYFHRFSQGDMHEYTPAAQENLETWRDMVTIHFYRKVKDGETLAATANTVLSNYKAAKGMVLKTSSVPKTASKAAEHLIVVVFGRPNYIEVAFARFQMQNGIGTAAIYSHRIYGQKAGDAMSAWLKKNGPATEKNLMGWKNTFKPPAAKK
jgi:hypothetical protein